MKKPTLIELETQRAEVAKQIRRYMDPFQKQDKGDICGLKYAEDALQNQIQKSGSEFLKAHGFRTNGIKRKVR